MFLARFDDATQFFDWVTAQTGTIVRYRTEYPVDDPPTIFFMYPIARDAAGLWIAVLDNSILNTDTRWQNSIRLSGWGW